MPRLRKKEEDEEFKRPEPKLYRKYNDSTKLKYCLMVKKKGVRASSAAKILKIKGSTAKEILKTFKHPLLDEDAKIEATTEKNNSFNEFEKCENKTECNTSFYPENQHVYYFLIIPMCPQFIQESEENYN